MKFFIMGANGFIGRNLTKYLLSQGHKVIGLIRDKKKADALPPECEIVIGNPLKEGSWQKKAVQTDVIVNLVGKNIFTRWTDKAKREIYFTRIESTKQAVNCLNKMKENGVLINGNAIGYYGVSRKEILKEDSPPGNDFLAKVCLDWQNIALSKADKLKRVVIARIAPVLGRDGGMISKILPIFKLGLGGKLGSGKQPFCWIHILDLVRAFEFIAQKKNINGPVNITSPHIITNHDFTKILGELLSRPTFFSVPTIFLRILFKDLADVMTKGSKVFPDVLIKEGFEFRFPNLKEALKEILKEETNRGCVVV